MQVGGNHAHGYPRLIAVHTVVIFLGWCLLVKLPLAIVKVILAPARPVHVLQVALHVHDTAVRGVGFALKPLDRAVEERHSHGTLGYTVQKHDVVLSRTTKKL